MMKILNDSTSDDPNGPWPPPGDGWVSICSVGGLTFWRLIEIGPIRCHGLGKFF
jgi:hypothetical protein